MDSNLVIIFAVMRGRDYRRYVEEIKLKKRLRRVCYWRWWYSGFTSLNNITTDKPTLADQIGTDNYKRYKTHTTSSWDTRDKMKYSPNRNKKSYYRGRSYSNTREYSKNEFIKILKENGIK